MKLGNIFFSKTCQTPVVNIFVIIYFLFLLNDFEYTLFFLLRNNYSHFYSEVILGYEGLFLSFLRYFKIYKIEFEEVLYVLCREMFSMILIFVILFIIFFKRDRVASILAEGTFKNTFLRITNRGVKSYPWLPFLSLIIILYSSYQSLRRIHLVYLESVNEYVSREVGKLGKRISEKNYSDFLSHTLKEEAFYTKMNVL